MIQVFCWTGQLPSPKEATCRVARNAYRAGFRAAFRAQMATPPENPFSGVISPLSRECRRLWGEGYDDAALWIKTERRFSRGR